MQKVDYFMKKVKEAKVPDKYMGLVAELMQALIESEDECARRYYDYGVASAQVESAVQLHSNHLTAQKNMYLTELDAMLHEEKKDAKNVKEEIK